jgi:uncharacterized protein YgiM (DUF1202 family)
MKNRATKHLSKATLLGLLGLFGLANLASAGAAESLFAQGNRSYDNGDYAGAIQCYQTIAQHQGVSPALLGNLALSGILLATGLGGIAIRLAQMDRAVVIGDQAPIRVSPYASARQLASVSEGRPLTVTGSHGEFLKVRTANGQTGWMAGTDIGRITVLQVTPPDDAVEVVSVDGPGPNVTNAESGG